MVGDPVEYAAADDSHVDSGDAMKHAFHLMAKPAGWRCNLACDYCFYLAKGQGVLRDTCGQWYMSDKVLETYIRQYIAASPGPEVNFTWQGGDIYSCDPYVDAAHRLGNLLQQPLEKLVASKAQRHFGQQRA